MTFTARSRSGEIVCAFDYESKFELLDAHPELFSPFPDCDQKVAVVSKSHICRMHFRHPVEFRTEYVGHEESMQHMLGKQYIMRMLRDEYRELPVEIRLEVPVELPNQKRIIDVAVFFKGKIIEAHEIQYSSQTPQELDLRSNDYLTLGIEPKWYFGGSAASIGRDWAMQRFGIAGVIETSEQHAGLRSVPR